MTRNLKALGLAFVAIFAISAVAASGAQASGAHFRANNGTAGNYIITGTADAAEPLQNFKVDGGEVECDIITAKATVETATTSEVTFNEVAYNSDFIEPNGPCEAFGLEAVVNFNGCHYTFHAGTWNEATNDSTGTADVACTPGKGPITITTPVCTVTVASQANLGPITFTNVAGTPDDITLHANVANITYSESGSLCKTETNNNGVYTGTATARAYEDKSGTEGTQVPLTVVNGGT